MNSSPSDLIGYCSLAKKNFGYKEAVGAWTIEIWSIYSLYFGYTYSVGDSLNKGHFRVINRDFQTL